MCRRTGLYLFQNVGVQFAYEKLSEREGLSESLLAELALTARWVGNGCCFYYAVIRRRQTPYHTQLHCRIARQFTASPRTKTA